MNIQERLLDLLTAAISQEEKQLAKCNPSGQRSDVKSVRQYEEAWLQHVILRAAMRVELFARVNCELSEGCRRADFSFEEPDGTLLAILELKMGRVGASLSDLFEKDYEKQQLQLKTFKQNKAQRFVAVLANGKAREMDEWLGGPYQEALDRLRVELPYRRETKLACNLPDEQLVLILVRVSPSQPPPPRR